jgi:RecA-family ATPase
MSFPLSSLDSRTRTRADWIIRGLLKRKNTLIMGGEPKRSGKSWLLLNALWDMATSQQLWSVPEKHGNLYAPRPLRSIYFTQEDTQDDLHDRYELCLTKRTPTDMIWYVEKDLGVCFDSEEGVQMLHKHIQQAAEHGPIDIIAFDPMRRMHSQDEQKSETMVRIWKFLDSLHKKYNCATWLNHHVKKPNYESGYYDPYQPNNLRGSSDIFGGADCLLVVVPHLVTREAIEIGIGFDIKRSAPMEICRLRILLDSGSVEFVGYGKTWEPTSKKPKKTKDPDIITM